MCSHYQAVKEREKFLKQFGVEPPVESAKLDMWPGYLGSFIRRHPHAEAVYEPDWRTGKAIGTRVEHVSGDPLGIAGLWSSWKNPKNGWVHSFTMLTLNADAHPLMNPFHKPTDEKRMVAILPPQHYQAWLDAKTPVMEFMVPFDAEQLQAIAPTPTNPTLL
jgi:hypothetical protein